MENQNLLLIVGLFFSGFLLWQAWTDRHEVKENLPKNNVSPSKNITPSDAADLPILDISQPTASSEITTAKREVVHVETDLLALYINTKGAIIEDLFLKKYPLSLLSATPVISIFSHKKHNLFKAQSGLLPKELPNHHSAFHIDKSYYNLEDDDTLIVPFYWENDAGVSVIKKYHFKRDSYHIGVNYEIKNQSKKILNYASYAQLLRAAIKEGNMFLPTYIGAAIYNDKGVYEKIDFDDFSDNKDISTKGGWMAMVQHYFFAAWIPNQNKVQKYTTKVLDNKYYLLSMLGPSLRIAPGETLSSEIDELYVGPKTQNRINFVDGLDKTVDYGILYIIAKPLEWLLHQIYGFVVSWGLAIILLTVLIKLVFYKLSETSYRSMAKMRKLTPKMQKIKELYGDDRQKVSKKMMDLYKKEKVNPASGCLPIIVQIPVFIALYWVLLESVELRHTAFWWLSDLSAKDPYFILPIIMGISMFAQQKLNPPPPDPMQAKIMSALPVVFTVFFFWMPSGLVLYWVINNILSIIQQWVINKRLAA